MKQKTYYQQVKTAVLPRLKFYRDDLLKIDRGQLRGYTGIFIHASRDSGTDLICFDRIDTFKALEWAIAFFFRETNDLFLAGINGTVKPATMRSCLELLARDLPNIARRIAKNELLATGYFNDHKWNGALQERSREVYRAILNGPYIEAGRIVDRVCKAAA